MDFDFFITKIIFFFYIWSIPVFYPVLSNFEQIDSTVIVRETIEPIDYIVGGDVKDIFI